MPNFQQHVSCRPRGPNTLDHCYTQFKYAYNAKLMPNYKADPLLAEELNTLYGCFKCNGGRATLPISALGSSRQSSDDHVITVSEDEVRRELKRVNVRKAAGTDGITGHVMRSCTDQLAGLFTSIFNESLYLCGSHLL